MSLESMDSKQESGLEAMWRQYSFPTEVPMAGSVAETNLRAKAKEYYELSTRKIQFNPKDTSRIDDDEKTLSELAIMIYGSSMLEADQRENLVNFAKDLSEAEKGQFAEAA